MTITMASGTVPTSASKPVSLYEESAKPKVHSIELILSGTGHGTYPFSAEQRELSWSSEADLSHGLERLKLLNNLRPISSVFQTLNDGRLRIVISAEFFGKLCDALNIELPQEQGFYGWNVHDVHKYFTKTWEEIIFNVNDDDTSHKALEPGDLLHNQYYLRFPFQASF